MDVRGRKLEGVFDRRSTISDRPDIGQYAIITYILKPSMTESNLPAARVFDLPHELGYDISKGSAGR